MRSSAEFVAGGTGLVTEGQLRTSSMDTQDPKWPCSPSHILRKADRDTQNGNASKKRSRKHQRFTARRALEQKDQKVLVKMDFFKVRPVETLEGEGKQCHHLFMEDSTKGQKKLDLHSLITPVSLGREPVKNPASLRGFKDWESLPNGSSTGSSSCPGFRKPRKCVAIDCEMVGTGPNGRKSELARCTVVNYDGDVIYDKYIRPELPVADYRTRWSGVTCKHLQNACPFRVAQGEILQILRDKIVVGHAIHNDFRALKYFHPQAWTRDTSRCPLLNKKMGLSEKSSVSLKNLACQLLQKKIQVGKQGHSSVEDAQTSMELYRLVEVPWEQMLSSSLLFCLPSESDTDSESYMDDRYWPKDLNIDCK